MFVIGWNVGHMTSDRMSIATPAGPIFSVQMLSCCYLLRVLFKIFRIMHLFQSTTSTRWVFFYWEITGVALYDVSPWQHYITSRSFVIHRLSSYHMMKLSVAGTIFGKNWSELFYELSALVRLIDCWRMVLLACCL